MGSARFQPGAVNGSTKLGLRLEHEIFLTTALPSEHCALCFHAGMAHAPFPVLEWSQVTARLALAERLFLRAAAVLIIRLAKSEEPFDRVEMSKKQ